MRSERAALNRAEFIAILQMTTAEKAADFV